MLDQGLRDRGVHVVVRHVIADAVRAPTQRQFAQIARPENDPIVKIGQSEQMRGALAGLHVLECDIIDPLAFANGWPMSLQHLHAAWPDIDLACADPQRFHERVRILQGDVARGESRHRVAEDFLAREVQAGPWFSPRR